MARGDLPVFEWTTTARPKSLRQFWMVPVLLTFAVLTLTTYLLRPFPHFYADESGSRSTKFTDAIDWHNSFPSSSPSAASGDRPKIGTVSVLWGTVPEAYHRAVARFAQYSRRYNYELSVLERSVGSGHWSKTLHLMYLILRELEKPDEDRLEWLLWFDADVILINQEIPLETFLPNTSNPLYEDIRFVAARDGGGNNGGASLNSGVFFARVHIDSVRIFAKAYAYHLYHPDANFGNTYDQTALQLVLMEDQNRRHVLWEPHSWFNPHQHEWAPGALCAHFFFIGNKAAEMTNMLDSLDSGQQGGKAQVPYEKSFYSSELDAFWDWNRRVRETLRVVEGFKLDETTSAFHIEMFNSTRLHLEDMLWHSDSYTKTGQEILDIEQRLDIALDETWIEKSGKDDHSRADDDRGF
ncbi:hypothetical protein LTS07_000850 [Exophiala sideris]|uniref:Galactosyl transferase GMA12/MNN10 family protein n=1 Tax=Exophiala sideris TaxID=1016849 RepID=A0ABR0JSR8_9EURO|nr:hypothetical protein LTS07_000850 [Exophiala sideris]KAK5068730.1 hypothetical protein LTR69_000851 [Exophiala sideris]KAK5186328.1 hypothetical protein LTR44_001384 [Eurotiomycetes sp. CCFEE 6388]